MQPRGPHSAIRLQRHAVKRPCGDAKDRPFGDADRLHKRGPLYCCFIPELTDLVRTCAPNTSIFFQYQAVEGTCSNSLCPARNHLHKTVFVDFGTISELAKRVATCSPHTAHRCHHYGVVPACSHGCHTFDASDYPHKNTLASRRPIAELTVIIITRSPHTAILFQNHGVLVSNSYSMHFTREHPHKLAPGRGGIVAKLPKIVISGGP